MKINIWKLTETLPGHHSETLYKTEEEAFDALLKAHADRLPSRPYDEKAIFIESHYSQKVVWSDGEVWEWEMCEEEFEVPDPKPEPRKAWAFCIQWGDSDMSDAPANLGLHLYSTKAEALKLMNKAIEDDVAGYNKRGYWYDLKREGDSATLVIEDSARYMHWSVQELEVPV